MSIQFNSISYSRSCLDMSKYNPQNRKAFWEENNRAIDNPVALKRMLRDDRNHINRNFQGAVNNILTDTLSYGESLKSQRENSKNAALEKKKLQYKYKDISSKIIRSKTSQAAKQAVRSAKLELQRLKKEKGTGKYDPNEIEAAIAHAKTMERVAKKKANHLLEEEMCNAAKGIGTALGHKEESGTEQSGIEQSGDNKVVSGEVTGNNNDGTYSVQDAVKMNGGNYTEYMIQGQERPEDVLQKTSLDIQDLNSFMEAIGFSEEDFSEEFMEEMEEGFRDMLEELGFGDLLDSVSSKKDMTPEELKLLKIKHRCKEMKEMVKADSEYLKVVFDGMEKARAAASVTSAGYGGVMSVQPVIDIASLGIGTGIPQAVDISV